MSSESSSSANPSRLGVTSLYDFQRPADSMAMTGPHQHSRPHCFTLNILLAPCLLPSEEGTMTVVIQCYDDMSCNFRCYVGNALNNPTVSNTVKHLFTKEDYLEFCETQNMHARTMDLASHESSLRGSIFYLRGKGFHLSAVFNILSAFQECYWNKVQHFFSGCHESTADGLVRYCLEYRRASRHNR